MESETASDFKAIRARFQEITANQIKNKPTVPEKPKQIPPPGACLLNPFGAELESNPSVVSKVIFKNGKKGPSSKRPMSYPLPLPPCTPSLFNGKTADKEDGVRQTSRDKRLSLVLPVPAKEQKPRLTKTFNSLSPVQSHKRTWFPFKTSPERRQYSLNPHSSSGTVEETVATFTFRDSQEECLKSPSQRSGSLAASPLPDDQGHVHLWGNSLSCITGTSAYQPVTNSENGSDTSGELHQKTSHTVLTSKVTETSCEDLAEDTLKKITDVPQPAIVSAVAVRLNAARHGMQISEEKRVDFETSGLQQGVEVEVPPPVIPLPSLDALGPQPAKPPRPPFVDLRCYRATLRNGHCESGTVGGPEDTASELPLPPKTVAPEYLGFPGSVAPETKAAALPGKGVGAAELVPKESKVLVLETLGLWPRGPGSTILEPPGPAVQSVVATPVVIHSSLGELPSNDTRPLTGPIRCDNADGVYEDVDTVGKFRWSQNTWRRKGIPKNPYAEVTSEDARKSSWFYNPCNSRKGSPEEHDERDQKKREKLRIERERKEQKEREKRENEMRKKFKVTGQEEPMYKAKVTVANKGRRGDLPVQAGDMVSIIRTTSCPKGKWLARDAHHQYGYIPVMNVELDIKEMLELGKKASRVAGCGGVVEGDTFSEGSRSSNQVPAHSSSFSDSEEWTCDEDSGSPSTETRSHNQADLVAERSGIDSTIAIPQSACSNITFEEDEQWRYEALDKLATFFHQQHDAGVLTENEESIPSISEGQQGTCSEDEQTFFAEQEADLHMPDSVILPPPELFADRE